jgi:toxin YoeB
MVQESPLTLRVNWKSKAAKQWKSTLQFYSERNGSDTYSEKLDGQMQRAIESLCRQPGMGEKTKRKGIRRLVVGNYALFYRFDTEELIVEAIIDGRRGVSLD